MLYTVVHSCKNVQIETMQNNLNNWKNYACPMTFNVFIKINTLTIGYNIQGNKKFKKTVKCVHFVHCNLKEKIKK